MSEEQQTLPDSNTKLINKVADVEDQEEDSQVELVDTDGNDDDEYDEDEYEEEEDGEYVDGDEYEEEEDDEDGNDNRDDATPTVIRKTSSRGNSSNNNTSQQQFLQQSEKTKAHTSLMQRLFASTRNQNPTKSPKKNNKNKKNKQTSSSSLGVPRPQGIRDSIHLTKFEIEDDDIIDFGKPLTSEVTSSNISKNKIESSNSLIHSSGDPIDNDEEPLQQRLPSSPPIIITSSNTVNVAERKTTPPRTSNQPQEEVILIEEESPKKAFTTTTSNKDHPLNTKGEGHTTFSLLDEPKVLKEELSFYQRWFNFSSPKTSNTPKLVESAESNNMIDQKEVPRKSIQHVKSYKIAILGEDIHESLIAAEFLMDNMVPPNFGSSPSQQVGVVNNAASSSFTSPMNDQSERRVSESQSMKQLFEYQGQHYELELFFYDIYDQFVNIIDQCLKECDGFLIVYNVCVRNSFNQIDILYEKLYKAKQGGTIALVLVGVESSCPTFNSRRSAVERRHSLLSTDNMDGNQSYSLRPSIASNNVNNNNTSTTPGSGNINTPTGSQNKDIDKEAFSQNGMAVLEQPRGSVASSSYSSGGGAATHHSVILRTATSLPATERVVSKREGLKKALEYYVPYIEMHGAELAQFRKQKVREIFHELLKEISYGGNLRFSAVKPKTIEVSENALMTDGNMDESQGVIMNQIEAPSEPTQSAGLLHSLKLLFNSLNVNGYCLTQPIGSENELRQIEFLIDHFESNQITCQVIEACLKRFDFRNVKMKLRQKIIPRNVQQILSFLFDIPLSKMSVLQSLIQGEPNQIEINERLVFAIFIATYAKHLYTEQNYELYDKTFMVTLEEEWYFVNNLNQIFQEVKKKYKDYTTLDSFVEDQVIRMVEWMEKRIRLRRGNEIEMLMKFLLLSVTSQEDHYGFEKRVKTYVLGIRYLVLKKIADNHNGRLYKAVKVKANRMCALKQLANISKADLFEIGSGIESGILFDKHDNVMTFSDYTIRRYLANKYEIFIELPFMNGGNLERKIEQSIKKNKYINYIEVLDIALQSARGLNHLHERGIVFPTLKPEKILLSYNSDEKYEKHKKSQQRNDGGNTPSTSSSFKYGRIMEEKFSEIPIIDNYIKKELSKYGKNKMMPSSSKMSENNTASQSGSNSQLKSLIIRALEDSTSILEEDFQSNLNVKLTDWFKPWDFTTNDYVIKNRKVMDTYSQNKNKRPGQDFEDVSYSVPTSHSSFRKQMALNEISSNNSTIYCGDIESYLDQKDDIFRLGCVFYQLITRESFLKMGPLNVPQKPPFVEPSQSNRSSVTTNTVVVNNVSTNNSHSEKQTMSFTRHDFGMLSLDESVALNETLAHQIIASKIHMSLLKSEAILILHTAVPQTGSELSPSTSTSGEHDANSERTVLMHQHNLDSQANRQTGSTVVVHTPSSTAPKALCSRTNENLLIALIQSMLKKNPTQRPSLARVILILEVLIKYSDIGDEILAVLMPNEHHSERSSKQNRVMYSDMSYTVSPQSTSPSSMTPITTSKASNFLQQPASTGLSVSPVSSMTSQSNDDHNMEINHLIPQNSEVKTEMTITDKYLEIPVNVNQPNQSVASFSTSTFAQEE
ncbi:hypothetical protein FDP41_003237 [Naegleria fowleri]|uniref:non-specific serine/threonine protein kinase n=1 Tax=Naegleria fowleri TaxID=5763 RepID=A0A6A5BX51_NAEFO|nr:uncharacterized protein FDP41_003237 [Naegleria fowleri]KAF0977915.1 hypothetical protein FDP41_003237 [Naegleria fowleri]